VLHLQSLRKHNEKPSWGTGDRATCTSLQLSLLQVASLRHSGILSKLHSALITAVHGSLGPSVPSIYPRQSPHEESSRSCSALPNPVIASPRLLTGDAGIEREGFMQLRNRPAMTQICPSSELLVNPDQGHSHSKTTIKKRTPVKLCQCTRSIFQRVVFAKPCHLCLCSIVLTRKLKAQKTVRVFCDVSEMAAL
jgi:hypothetical protein